MKGGGTLRDHLNAALRNGENVADELDLGPMPDSLVLPMQAFREVARGRDFAEGGPLPLSSREILAWFELAGRRPNPTLTWFIRQIDDEWLIAMRKETHA